MKLTTLCYIESGNKYLMLHRISKKKDANAGKWIGVGGHFEESESPEECMLREVYEETGLTLTSWKQRAVITFCSDQWETEYMHLFTADAFTGELTECKEGKLAWIEKGRIGELELWEGDKIFLGLLDTESSFFSLKLCYKGEKLEQAVLNGTEIVWT